MITYNDIYEAARKERYSEQLQQIPKNFVEEISSYLRDKKEIASKEDDTFSNVIIKTKKQIENATTLFKELMLRRRKKLLGLVLIAAETGISKHDFDNMLSFERDLFEEMMKSIDIIDKKISGVMEGKKNGEVIKNELILFNEPVEEFMGLDGKSVGPFEKGQMVNISKEVAKILVDDGKAEIVGE